MSDFRINVKTFTDDDIVGADVEVQSDTEVDSVSVVDTTALNNLKNKVNTLDE